MANTRHTLMRELVIDECLRGSRHMSTKEILSKVNSFLINNQQTPVATPSTIIRDIRSIGERWKTKIIEEKIGRVVYYYYEDPNFSIFNSKITKQQMEKMLFTLEYISEFVGLPNSEWLNETKALLYSKVFGEAKRRKPFVLLSRNPMKDTTDRLFDQLSDYVLSGTSIELTYKRFNQDEERTHIISPYQLLEYQQRWYLFGLNVKHTESPACFALDRILSVKESEATFIDKPGFDAETYFGSVLGLTIPDGAVPQDVLLWVANRDYPYLETNPIHPSQQYVRDENDGKVISLHVILNYELEMRIFAYGDRMKVLAPESFRLAMNERIASLAKLCGVM